MSLKDDKGGFSSGSIDTHPGSNEGRGHCTSPDSFCLDHLLQCAILYEAGPSSFSYSSLERETEAHLLDDSMCWRTNSWRSFRGLSVVSDMVFLNFWWWSRESVSLIPQLRMQGSFKSNPPCPTVRMDCTSTQFQLFTCPTHLPNHEPLEGMAIISVNSNSQGQIQ